MKKMQPWFLCAYDSDGIGLGCNVIYPHISRAMSGQMTKTLPSIKSKKEKGLSIIASKSRM